MSKYKRGHQQSVDGNELEIINKLESIGLFVVRGMDDFLVYADVEGFFDPEVLYQVEVKKSTPFNKNGTLKVGFIKDSQYKMLCHANNYYFIGWDYNQIRSNILCDDSFAEQCIDPDSFRCHYKEWLTPKELNRLRQLPWWNLG